MFLCDLGTVCGMLCYVFLFLIWNECRLHLWYVRPVKVLRFSRGILPLWKLNHFYTCPCSLSTSHVVLFVSSSTPHAPSSFSLTSLALWGVSHVDTAEECQVSGPALQLHRWIWHPLQFLIRRCVLACQWALTTWASFSVIWSKKLQTGRQAVSDGCGEKFIMLVYKLVKALSLFEEYFNCSLEWNSFYVIVLCSFRWLCRNDGNETSSHSWNAVVVKR